MSAAESPAHSTPDPSETKTTTAAEADREIRDIEDGEDGESAPAARRRRPTRLRKKAPASPAGGDASPPRVAPTEVEGRPPASASPSSQASPAGAGERLLRLSCSQCEALLTVPARLAGQTGTCKSCGKEIRVPGAPRGDARPPEASVEPAGGITFACSSCSHEMTVPPHFAGLLGRCKGCGAETRVPPADDSTEGRDEARSAPEDDRSVDDSFTLTAAQTGPLSSLRVAVRTLREAPGSLALIAAVYSVVALGCSALSKLIEAKLITGGDDRYFIERGHLLTILKVLILEPTIHLALVGLSTFVVLALILDRLRNGRFQVSSVLDSLRAMPWAIAFCAIHPLMVSGFFLPIYYTLRMIGQIQGGRAIPGRILLGLFVVEGIVLTWINLRYLLFVPAELLRPSRPSLIEAVRGSRDLVTGRVLMVFGWLVLAVILQGLFRIPLILLEKPGLFLPVSVTAWNALHALAELLTTALTIVLVVYYASIYLGLRHRESEPPRRRLTAPTT